MNGFKCRKIMLFWSWTVNALAINPVIVFDSLIPNVTSSIISDSRWCSCIIDSCHVSHRGDKEHTWQSGSPLLPQGGCTSRVVKMCRRWWVHLWVMGHGPLGFVPWMFCLPPQPGGAPCASNVALPGGAPLVAGLLWWGGHHIADDQWHHNNFGHLFSII